VKHIKIQRSYDSLYYIADCKMFKSIPELVKYYQQNSLQPSFSEVPTTLQFPFKEVTPIWIGDAHIIGYCQANYDYTATEACQLSLKQGDLVAILSKVGGARGWWKGRLNGKVGYFPSGFVVESDEDGNVITFVN
ncbi:hypothetical protein HELRODRAFT_90064, partial [Helobdella robusta]|uniref:SH3 domain-containing protein n=1 Tax=Helobdella robusta TaxID=6412 RepID=T1G7K6_HELRO